MPKVEFKNNKGLKIVGVLDLPKTNEPFPGVVVLHGFGGTKENNKEWDELLTPLGIAVLRIDFCGSGLSEGKFEDKTMTNFIDDTTSAISYLCRLPQTNKNMIGIVGHSAGAFAAILVAARDMRIKTLIASVPGVHEGQIIAGLYDEEDFLSAKTKGYVEASKYSGIQKLNYSFFEDIEQYDLIKEANKIPFKFLLIGARKDRIVPWNEIEEIKTKVPNAVLLELPTSDHNLEEDWPIAESSIKNWFSKWLGK